MSSLQTHRPPSPVTAIQAQTLRRHNSKAATLRFPAIRPHTPPLIRPSATYLLHASEASTSVVSFANPDYLSPLLPVSLPPRTLIASVVPTLPPVIFARRQSILLSPTSLSQLSTNRCAFTSIGFLESPNPFSHLLFINFVKLLCEGLGLRAIEMADKVQEGDKGATPFPSALFPSVLHLGRVS
jgi:hypothetical protein